MKLMIVGGGFAGFTLARVLNNDKEFDIVLIDRFNYHQFQPLFYQLATGGLDASNISFPLRKAFQKSKNVRIRLANLLEIDHENNKAITDIGEFDYDALILATGADTNFFGNTEIMKYAYPMKGTVQAIQLRNAIIENFENALVAKTEEELESLMTVVVVGGGPTGVELSGALGEMRRWILPKDYPELDFRKMRIFLIEGSGKTLGTMSEKSSVQSRKYLEDMGITVVTNTVVKEYNGKWVLLSSGEKINASVVIWAAGIKGNVPEGTNSKWITKGNRLIVDRFNKVKGTENIYALGDIAYMETELYPSGHPQVANVAINQARMLAKNLGKKLRGNQMTPFEYKDKGSLATVGRYKAVVDFPGGKLHFGGAFAWFVWMSLHLILLLGTKNRLQVLINWAYKYFTYDQSLRLIFKEFNKPGKT